MVSRVSVVAVRGPLSGAARVFEGALADEGYTPLSAANQLRLLAHLSRWMSAESLSPSELDGATLDRFLAVRRDAGYTGWLSLRGLGPLVRVLRGEGLIPAATAAPMSPVDVLLVEFADYLRAERGLAEVTIGSQARAARPFLELFGNKLADLSAADVARHVSSRCVGIAVGTAKYEVTGLRSVLRFLHVSGRVEADLSAAVLGVAGWRHAGVPKGLTQAEVAALLGACDPARPPGRRDLAVVLLLVRLGLRRGEVSRLRLDDLEWRAGELTVVGKASRVERLPLPVDVGEAVAEYLVHERRASSERVVFLSCRAPHGPLSPAGVTCVVENLAARAGLGRVGAHRLRHTTATAMLTAGADLVEIGQVLRHRSLSTTTIYAKVDLARLRRLAPPWPASAFSEDERRERLRSLAPPWPYSVVGEAVSS